MGEIQLKINEIMNSSVILVKAEESIGNALDIMKNENINGVPVVNEDNQLLGIVVKADIYRFLIDPGHYKTCPVEWVMTKEVVKAEVHEDITVVAKRLRDNDIIALPVIEKDSVVGMVSIEDFMDYYINQ